MTKEERLKELIDQGAMIGYVDQEILAAISYGELWPEVPALFFVELYQQAHVLTFSRFEEAGDMLNFFERDKLKATMAPYAEWPEEEANLSALLHGWKDWLANPQRQEMIDHFKETAAMWRPDYQK